MCTKGYVVYMKDFQNNVLYLNYDWKVKEFMFVSDYRQGVFYVDEVSAAAVADYYRSKQKSHKKGKYVYGIAPIESKVEFIGREGE